MASKKNVLHRFRVVFDPIRLVIDVPEGFFEKKWKLFFLEPENVQKNVIDPPHHTVVYLGGWPPCNYIWPRIYADMHSYTYVCHFKTKMEHKKWFSTRISFIFTIFPFFFYCWWYMHPLVFTFPKQKTWLKFGYKLKKSKNKNNLQMCGRIALAHV